MSKKTTSRAPSRRKDVEPGQNSGLLFQEGASLAFRWEVPGFSYFASIVLAFLCLLGFASTFSTIYKIDQSHSNLMLGVAVFPLLFGLIYFNKYTTRIGLPIAFAGFAGVCVWMGDRLLPSAYMAYNALAARINTRIPTELPYVSYSFAEGDSSDLCFMLVFFLLSAGICWFILRRPSLPMVLLLSFPVIEVGMFVGLVPAYFSFLLLVAAYAGIGAMQVVRQRRGEGTFIHPKRKKDVLFYNGGHRKWLSMIVSAILIAAVCLSMGGATALLAPALYDSTAVQNFRDDMAEALEDFPLSGNFGGASGGLNGGKLYEVDGLHFTGQTALRVTGPYFGDTFYLRGFVGGEYIRTAWLPADMARETQLAQEMYDAFESSGSHPQNLQGETVSLARKAFSNQVKRSVLSHVKIENRNANSAYTYTPYNGLFSGDDVTFSGEANVSVKSKKRKYEFDYFALPSMLEVGNLRQAAASASDAPADYTERLAAYEAYVHQTYTELPDKGLSSIRAACTPEKYRELGGLEGYSKYVRTLLQSNKIYDMNPGKVPEGEDFITYFYDKMDGGFCVHYASAAVAMFRAAGVPARYVEGYLVKGDTFSSGKDAGDQLVYDISGEAISNPARQVDVLDYSAHAWAEVYVDGYGWIPMEMTTTFRDPYDGYSYPLLSGDRSPLEGEDSAEGEENVGGVDGPQTVQEKFLGFRFGDTWIGQLPLPLMILLFVGALLTLFLAALLLRAGIVRAGRASRYRRAGHTQRVLLDYGRLERVLRYLGEGNRQHLPLDEYAASLQIRHLTVHEGDFAKALELAQKARFSKGGCTAGESRWMEAFVAHFAKRVFKDLSLPKQFSFRFIHLN